MRRSSIRRSSSISHGWMKWLTCRWRRSSIEAAPGEVTSPRLRGEVGFYAKRKIRVRGTLNERVRGESPSPQPSQSELCSSRPRKRGAREKKTQLRVPAAQSAPQEEDHDLRHKE